MEYRTSAERSTGSSLPVVGGSAENVDERRVRSIEDQRRNSEERFVRPWSGTGGQLLYLDPRTLTRDCVGRWLNANLEDFRIGLLSHPDEIGEAAVEPREVRVIVYNVGLECVSSALVGEWLERFRQALPDVPVVLLADREDPDEIIEALALGVRGYIPTSLTSDVAAEAVRLVCAGGTFAPAAALFSASRERSRQERGSSQAGGRMLDGFTQRQAQILDCLRRGMANKLIAYELSMCESTVKVHVRNIMKKLNATNRTQVAYLTHKLFDEVGQLRT
ncbi:MAG: LuxR C-terminal-related transcriptional regulator [Geminicoccaceae bacterium]